MGNTKSLIISVILTGFAILLGYTYIQQKQAKLYQDLGTFDEVLVATKNIGQYQSIDTGSVELRRIPRKYVQPNYIANIKDLKDTVTAVPVAENETITTNKLLFLGQKTGLAPIVSKGKRAIAIRATTVNSVANLIKPGDRIDILAQSVVAEGTQNTAKVTTVLQDVFVLSVGTDVYTQIPTFIPNTKMVTDFKCIQPDRGSEAGQQFSNITIEVTPKEAQKIVALSNAELYYTLRNPNDRGNESITPTTDREIFGLDK